MTDKPQGSSAPRLTDEELLATVPSGTGGKEASIGLFVLIGLISFVIVIFWMTDPATLRGRYIVVTSVGNAGGVRSGDPVQMQGVNIGRVHDFAMVGAGRVDITLEIVRGESTDSYAEGDTLPGEGASAAGLLGSVDELSAQAGTVLSSIDSLLNPETVGNVQSTARQLEELLTELTAVTREQRASIGRLTESLTRSAQGLESATAAGPDVARVVARADSAMASLNTTAGDLDAATTSLRSVLARMDAGQGTLGMLSTDRALYDNLNGAAESLRSLLDDLKANPNKYINISIF
jgi:phospholipid/cholesterol/gamma-HCH transport system substrate-binding protein